jgi:uncharacterized protein YhhL (DUF1145 family)
MTDKLIWVIAIVIVAVLMLAIGGPYPFTARIALAIISGVGVLLSVIGFFLILSNNRDGNTVQGIIGLVIMLGVCGLISIGAIMNVMDHKKKLFKELEDIHGNYLQG